MRGIPVRSNGDPVTRTLVLAGSYSQFGNWCMFSRVNPRSRMVWYVRDCWTFWGHADFDLVYTGTYSDRRDFGQLIHELSYLRALDTIKTTWDQAESCEIEPDVVD